MSNSLLAFAIGANCGRHRGLYKLVLPRSLPQGFKDEVCRGLESANGVPVPIGDGDGEYSAGEAIAFRTPEGGSVDQAIVLIATEGQVRELKSLEVFRDLLASGMPGGSNALVPAVLRLDAIASKAAQLAASSAGVSLNVNRLALALNLVFSYLAEAYREAGNDEKRWTEAYWQHADMLVNRLPRTIKGLPSGTPSFERDVVFASAGLPRPDGPEGYADKNSPPRYASIVLKSWNSLEDIFRSLAIVDQIDGEGSGPHPLVLVGWSDFPSTRTSLGHPLLALANHGAGTDDGVRWLHGWASTSEKAFFEAMASESIEIEYELCSLSEDGDCTVLSALNWMGLDHILPSGPTTLREDGQISLGKFRLRMTGGGVSSAPPARMTLEVRPSSACRPETISHTATDGYLLIEFELLRRGARKGGKWREKPFTLSISQSFSFSGSKRLNSLSLKLCAPHPARPTAIAVEHPLRGNRLRPAFATDGRYEVDDETRAIGFDRGNQETALLKLSDGTVSASLAVVGLKQDPKWDRGQTLTRRNPADLDAALRFYGMTPLPEDAVIVLDEYRVTVQEPEVDSGQVNPIFASILAEPVRPADDNLRRELLSDPRGLLEDWYARNCISASPRENFRACLGACVLEAAGHGTGSLVWNATIGAFADTDAPLHLAYPRRLATTLCAEAFWEAFDHLDLGTCGGTQEMSVWPSALDLRRVSKDSINCYLSAFCDLLKTIGEPTAKSWLAYPFSALLYDQTAGEAKGVLLSPLHPLRLAWAWSVQQASDELAGSSIFGQMASAFLRFVDGELLPLSGPATRGSERWVATGLASGPDELFVGWTLLASAPLRESHGGMAIRLMGLDLPFGTPSGLDRGGVSASLRDYMRTYPASPQLRIGLAKPRGGKRYAETDEALVAASGDLIAQYGYSLPGGVRILDASGRHGRPPSPVNVLRRILPGAMDTKDPADRPPFEWTTQAREGHVSKVDIQFIEDTVVRVRTERINDGSETIGTSGPDLPFSRYRSWRHDELASEVSSFALGLQEDCFGQLPSFPQALGRFESLKLSGAGLKLTAELALGTGLLGDHARWTITGNRHVDPCVLSSQLRAASAEIALWEWRPAFLSRQKQKGATVSVASSHPYTVLARPSSALKQEVTSLLEECGMASSDDDVRDVIASLGVRGVGLSSLLTMGHTQSLGAIGFSLAFKTLETWESRAAEGEVRCVVPMDAVYPLLEVLGEGAGPTDEQRRADLLLISARFPMRGACSLHLHAVEVKMRSGGPRSFPRRDSVSLNDPFEQLASTHGVLERLCQNHEAEGQRLSLANAALATLLEAAFSLRPASSTRCAPLETRLLGAVASGSVVPSASRGTLLWFQVGATGAGGGPYEQRSSNAPEPGNVFVNPASIDDHVVRAEIGEVVASIIEGACPPTDLIDEGRQENDERRGGKPSQRDDVQPEIHGEPERPISNNDSVVQPPFYAEERATRDGESRGIATQEQSSAPEGIEILVGSVPEGSSMRPIYFKPSETALNQLNIGVVGDLGTGKTQFLKSLVYQLSRSGASNRGHVPKVFIFDYKRDYSEGDFPEKLGAKILDPSKQPLPINFFSLGVNPGDPAAARMERVRRANFFCDLLRRISGIGQVQRNDLYKSVMTAYEACAHGHAPSINDVFDVYDSLGKSDSVVSVLTLMRDLMVFEPDSRNTATFGELFDRSTVLNLADLGAAGQDIVDIVATMFLDNLYTDYMKRLPKEPFIDGSDGISRRRIDSFVLIDEAHHAMGRDFDVLMKLMLEGREFGMGVVLSSQFLSHFDANKHDWSEALSTWVVHNVRKAASKQFERIGFRRDVSRMVADVTGLKTHWAYYRCVNGYDQGTLMKGQPFYALS